MAYISAEEWEVLGFFGVEPETDDDTPWPYNDFLYRIERHGLSLSCAIAPSYKDIRIILKQGENKLYELNAVGVGDVSYQEEHNGREVLNISINEAELIRLVVNPGIELNHYYEEQPNK